MQKFKRIISSVLSLLLCSVFLLMGVGCNERSAAELAYSLPQEFEIISTTSVAENSNFSLIWNEEKKCVILYDKIRDCEWSYIPQESLNTAYDYANEGNSKNVHPRVKSPIIVHYYNSGNNQEDETNAFAMSINKGTYSVKAIENGLEMTCYFDDRFIAVPVEFKLNDKGLDISIDPTKIQETDTYCVASITLAPYFCSVSNANEQKDDHYLFVPSGSGAIVSPVVDTTREAATIFSEYVYGQDANLTMFENATVLETVRMPVYGAVNGDKGVLAIIKSGAESAKLNTTIGFKAMGYSNICPQFAVRGYQEVVKKLFTNTVTRTKLYADAFISEKIEVGFYPLYGEDASYVGMADTYRDYLKESNAVNTEKSNDSLLSVKLYGGVQTKEFHFGIPSTAMLPVTTLNQAYKIVKDVTERTQLNNINFNLVGFGDSGLDVGVVAGDCEINSEFGDEDDLKKIIKYCNANGSNLFMNFDMIRFNASGNGVTTAFGKADAANGSYTELNFFDLNFRGPSATQDSYYLVARTEFSEVAANIKEVAKEWKLPGISLDTLTSISYSDYSDKQYYGRSNFDNQTAAILNAYKNDGYRVAGSDANAFAAVLCSHVYDVPMQSSKYRILSHDVPFYQIVFKGLVSMSGNSLNLSTNEQTNFLKAVETGTGLTYSLIGEYDSNVITSAYNVFYGSVYWDDTINRGVRDSIVERVAEYRDYFESVNGATIVDHEIINENVRKTTFDNGVIVYVNYGDNDYSEGDVTVAANGYKVM